MQSVVRRHEADWRAFNRHRKAFALSRLERELFYAGEHPVRFSLSLLSLLASTWILAQVLPEDWFVATWGKWQASEQLAYFSTLWTVQATLAALVYPIVIAFVTVFLQKRPAAEAFLHLYLLDSGALAAGLSSLMLVLVMAVQYFWIPAYGAQSLLMWVAFDTGWFLINAALTTYFLFRTVEFLRPEVQAHVVRRYTVNVALPRDVMRLNSFQVLAHAQEKGWIPAPAYGDTVPEGPKLHLSRFAFRDGETQGAFQFKEPVRLVNVRLFFLRVVVASWMRAARTWPVPQENQPFSRNVWPLLTIPMAPGTVYRDSSPLARVASGPRLIGWQRKLLRFSYMFRPIKKERFGIQVKSILDELEADTKIAAGRLDVEAFERAYEALVSLHQLLLGASLKKNDDGTVGSWALLPNIHSFAERALYWEWADMYRSVFLASIEAMVSDTRPVRRLCHLVQHLGGDDLNASPGEVQESILQLPPLMMYQLGRWWVQRVEEQGIMEHGAHQMATLRAPLYRVYEEVISTFVAGWENARITIANIPDIPNFEWATASRLGRLNAAHIQETARMLLAAVVRGDRATAEWMADVLGKWWGNFAFEHQIIGLQGKAKYLTLDHVNLEWTVLSNLIGFSEQEIRWSNGNVRVLQRGAFMAALQNFWTDVRLLVVELLLYWAEQDESLTLNESLAMEIVVGLLIGKQWRGGGTLSRPLNEFSAANYLEAKVRQYGADGQWQSAYSGRLIRFVERVKDMERPDMVSSRVYSFSGADDLDSLQEQQLILLAVFSSTEWSASESLRRQVDIWISRQYVSIDILRQKTAAWLQRFNEREESSLKVLTVLLRRTGKLHDVMQGIAYAKHGVESLRDITEARRAEVLAAEPIEPERLAEISRHASDKAFKSETGKFPLQLFTTVQFTAEGLQDFTLGMKDVRKGELTRAEMDQRPANEKEFWTETMARQVSVVVLSDVISACKAHNLVVTSAESYWTALKTGAAQISERGEHPVLILENATRPEWVWQWQHADYDQYYARPDDLRVQRFDDRGDAYLCNFNEIEVFIASIPAGQSILLSREAFNAVQFTEFKQGLFVDTSFVEHNDSKLLVDLNLRFSRKVEVGHNEIFILNYASASSIEAQQDAVS